MGFEVYKKLIDGFTTLKDLHLQGLGEPMMHPRFFEMVHYAAQRGITVSTNSNFTLLNDFMTLIALLRDSPQPRRPEERSRRRRVSTGRAGASGVLSQKDEGRPFRGAKRSVSHDGPQVVDIIGASESVISRKCLFSTAWAPFRFAVFSTRAVGPPKSRTGIPKDHYSEKQ